MSVYSSLLKMVGEKGLPTIVDKSLEDTWQVYEKQSGNDRVVSVLGFMFLVRQAGLRRFISLKADPRTLYKKIRQEEFVQTAKDLVTRMNRYRLLDEMRVYKSRFSTVLPFRGNEVAFRFDLCFEPRKKQPLDDILDNLRGLLYTGELPKQLQEVWRKTQAKAKAKSALPLAVKIMNSDSTLGFLALAAEPKFSIFARRAADDLLVLRIVLKVVVPKVPWLNDRAHMELLRSLMAKAVSKLKG